MKSWTTPLLNSKNSHLTHKKKSFSIGNRYVHQKAEDTKCRIIKEEEGRPDLILSNETSPGFGISGDDEKRNKTLKDTTEITKLEYIFG